jgi:thiol-disulfide isomerase/thioredoxin
MGYNTRKRKNRLTIKTDKKMTKKRVILSFILAVLTLGTSCFASDNDTKNKGYKFIFTVHDATDSVLYLGRYYNRNQYAIDTAYRNKKNQFIFERKNKTLEPGLYFFTNTKDKFAEFTINEEPRKYKFTTHDTDWVANMEIKGSPDNEKFFAYQMLRRRMNMSIDSVKIASESRVFNDYRRKVGKDLDSINIKFVEENPNHILSLIMKATKEIDVPAVNDKGDSLTQRERFDYYCKHYFDNMSLDNEAILRTPSYVFYDKVDKYFDKVLNGATPKTICEYADMAIEKARPAKNVFKYLILNVAQRYIQSNVMSYDEIYVHMIEKYYMTGEAFWASPSDIEFETKRAMTWKKLLLGEKAPELILKDINGKWHSLYQVPNKYTLLVFWAPSCGHCATIIPALYKFYDEYKDVYDIGTFAINTDIGPEDIEKWKKYVEEKNLNWDNYNGAEANVDWHEAYDIISTPVIYLLDKDKKIIGKKLDASVLEQLMAIIEPEKAEVYKQQKNNAEKQNTVSE